jgi:ubiquitin-protein ligase E3 A
LKVINGEGRWGRGYSVNDDDAITGATKVMKLLFYASVLGGQCDPASLLAEEREINDTDYSQELLQGAVGLEPKELRLPKEDPLAKELGVNPLDCKKPLVPFDDFINEPLNDFMDIDTDYRYKMGSDSKFSFVNYSFILTTASKHMSMYFDNRIRMLNERRTSRVYGFPPMPFLRIRVRRDHLIDDCLVAVSI